jgi:hypothetical protein
MRRYEGGISLRSHPFGGGANAPVRSAVFGWRSGLRVGAVVLATMLAVAGGTIRAVAAAPATVQQNDSGVFPNSPLVPGMTLTGRIYVPSSVDLLTPYLRFLDVREGCVKRGSCPTSGHLLSSVLFFSINGPNQTFWRGTVKSLREGIVLPGQPLARHAPPRAYDISVTLPREVTNSVEGRTLSFSLQYGGENAAGRLETQVLGEAFGSNSSATGAGGGSLPFTGADLASQFAAGAGLLLAGFGLVGGARCRFRRGGP